MMMRSVAISLLLGAGVTGLCGCTSTTVDYAQALVELPAAGEGPVGVAVRDTRGVALINPSWVGVARKSMGIPSEVHTRSGRSFAVEFAEALGASLAHAGYRPQRVEVRAGSERDEVLRKLRASTEFHRWLLVDVADWSSDGYFGELTLAYRVYLEVGASGAESMRLQLEGEKETGYGERGGYSGACRRLFSEIASELLGDLQLVEPVEEAPASRPAAAARCPECGGELEEDWRVCPYCATPR